MADREKIMRLLSLWLVINLPLWLLAVLFGCWWVQFSLDAAKVTSEIGFHFVWIKIKLRSYYLLNKTLFSLFVTIRVKQHVLASFCNQLTHLSPLVDELSSSLFHVIVVVNAAVTKKYIYESVVLKTRNLLLKLNCHVTNFVYHFFFKKQQSSLCRQSLQLHNISWSYTVWLLVWLLLMI